MPSVSTHKNENQTQAVATDAVLRRYVGYRLKRAYNTIRADLLDRLEPLGLRITTFSTLLLIVDQPGVRQSALANLLDIKSSNMVAIIDDLESRHWISRQRVPEDRRVFALYATESGKQTYDRAVVLGAENESVVLHSLDNEELGQLLALLNKIETSVGIN